MIDPLIMTNFLTAKFDISQTMLAALLSVTSQRLTAWNKMTAETLEDDQKAWRLHCLYEVVWRAMDKGVRADILINLLQSPIAEGVDDSVSLLYWITEYPKDSFFYSKGQALDKMIADFLEETK